MIKDGKYRFTLQFGMNTVEEQRAGQLLERLGNKKSPIVIAALNEYLDSHPELLEGTAHIQFHVSNPSPQQLEKKIRQLIEERLTQGSWLPSQAPVTEEAPKQVSDDILDMLSDLEMFS